jgi:hypothetical protein
MNYLSLFVEMACSVTNVKVKRQRLVLFIIGPDVKVFMLCRTIMKRPVNRGSAIPVNGGLIHDSFFLYFFFFYRPSSSFYSYCVRAGPERKKKRKKYAPPSSANYSRKRTSRVS